VFCPALAHHSNRQKSGLVLSLPIPIPWVEGRPATERGPSFRLRRSIRPAQSGPLPFVTDRRRVSCRHPAALVRWISCLRLAATPNFSQTAIHPCTTSLIQLERNCLLRFHLLVSATCMARPGRQPATA
jgi:hypothetical protein